jgi:hypothetical protein
MRQVQSSFSYHLHARVMLKAVLQALRDKMNADASMTPAVTKTYNVMVVGAGRGPLVDACMRAADDAFAQVKLYALEKNPNAVIMYVPFSSDRQSSKHDLSLISIRTSIQVATSQQATLGWSRHYLCFRHARMRFEG